jgi:hypothetical protein
VINKHTKGEEKRSFQAFLREEMREPRSEEQGTSKKDKKISLVSLPDDDTRLQTHHEEEEDQHQQQQQRGKRKKKTTGGSTARDRPAGPRHGTGERPANGLGRQRDPVDSTFLPDCPFSSSREASELLLPPRELPVP